MKAILKINILIVMSMLLSGYQYAQTVPATSSLPDSIQNEILLRQNKTEYELLLKLIAINKEIALNQEYMINEIYQNQLKLNGKIDSLSTEFRKNIFINDTTQIIQH